MNKIIKNGSAINKTIHSKKTLLSYLTTETKLIK